MKFNLAKNSNTSTNNVVGNVSLFTYETLQLLEGSGTSTISGTGSDVFCLDSDLGKRIKVDEIRYYFSSSTASGTVASSIEFFYKNDGPDSFSQISTSVGNGYYYSTVPNLSSPRYVRLVHTVSGTSISGTMQNFQILNDDEDVDFGTDGTDTSVSSSAGLYGTTDDDITTVAIYNDSNDFVNTAYVSLEPQYSDVDDLLTISGSSVSDWIGVYDGGIIIGDSSKWDWGNHSDTKVLGDDLVLETDEPVGDYTTRIFYADSPMTPLRIKSTETDGSAVTKDLTKITKTMEIRSTNTRPLDYSIYRKFRDVGVGGGNYQLKFSDYWRADWSLKYQSDTNLEEEGKYGEHWNYFYIDIDKQTGYFVALAHYDDNYYAGWSSTVLLRVSPSEVVQVSFLRKQAANWGDDSYEYVSMDSVGGIWTHFYAGWDDTWYLRHFNSSLGGTYNVNSSDQFVYDCSVDYDRSYLWYTDISSNTVVCIDTTGTNKSTFIDTEHPGAVVRGVYANSDSGCWFVSGSHLLRLDKDGTLVDTIENVGDSEELTKVCVDSCGGFWVIDGSYVNKISSGGTTDFSVYIPLAKSLHPINDGVWVYTSDGYNKFINRNSQTVINDINSWDGRFGYLDYTYDSEHASDFPIDIDTTWSGIDWNEVSSEYTFPDEQYHQVRLTLQTRSEMDVIEGGTSWSDYQMVLGINQEGTYDTDDVYGPSVIKDGLSYKMWYVGSDSSNDERILYATSNDKTNWSNHQMVIDIGDEGTYDTNTLSTPSVIKDGSIYKMWYSGHDSNHWRILYAESSNGTTWSGHQMVVDYNQEGTHDTEDAYGPSVMKDGSTYKMWYSGNDVAYSRVMYCNSSDGINWNNHQMVIDKNVEGTYDTDRAYYPTVIKDDSTYKMWYAGYDGSYIRILYSDSTDGINWSNHQMVISRNSEGTYDEKHVYQPCVVKDGYVYDVWYVAGTNSNIYRILHATSNDVEQLVPTGVSPSVSKVFVQKLLEVEDIPVNEYKNIYLKTQVPSSDPDLLGSHSSNLNVWWMRPTNI